MPRSPTPGWIVIKNFLRRTFLFLPRKIFLAGETQEETLRVAKKLNLEGFLTTIDILGEKTKDEADIQKTLDNYLSLISKIREFGLNSTISIKMSHLGLALGYGQCFNAVKILADAAKLNGVGIEFDMEQFEFNSDTISIFKNVSKPSEGNRICLQANVYKSCNDLVELHKLGLTTRLVKGAYKEKPTAGTTQRISTRTSNQTLSMFWYLAHYILSEVKQNGPRHAIGTRDKKIIELVGWYMRENNLSKECIEFQLLYGYLNLGRQLLNEGYCVRIYLPYGKDDVAFPYIWRRIKTPHNWLLLFDWLKNKIIPH